MPLPFQPARGVYFLRGVGAMTENIVAMQNLSSGLSRVPAEGELLSH
jgi:hypothetical protein